MRLNYYDADDEFKLDSDDESDSNDELNGNDGPRRYSVGSTLYSRVCTDIDT